MNLRLTKEAVMEREDYEALVARLELMNEWKQLGPTELMKQGVLCNAEQSRSLPAIALAS